MIFIDELKKAFGIMLKPGSETKESKSIGEMVAFYYKVTVIPAIIAIIIGAIGLASSGYGVINFVLALVGLWVEAPIAFFAGSAYLHLFGKIILKTFKGNYSNTFTATVYTYMPSVVLFWLTMLLTVLATGAISLGAAGLLSLFSLVIALWAFIISLFALANQNSTTKLRVFLTQVVAAIPLIIIVVIVALFSLNLFNTAGPRTLSACIGQPGFSCTNPSINQNGHLTVEFGQGTGYTMYNVSVACVSSANATAPQNLLYNQITAYGSTVGSPESASLASTTSLGIGSQTMLTSIQCYPASGPTLGMLSPLGSSFTGFIYIAYATTPGGTLQFVKAATMSVASST
ncbi:MAG: hypothetical protein KGH94_02870 [Candidatus Micrarchaeota archaeon]|nr:hypothetical protein [Candidatus Micrarchaeota archaeon]